MEFRIRRQAVDEIVAHARQTAPAECCGILVGQAGTVVEAIRATNTSSDPNRFFIDPKDHIDARRNARQRGLEVLGFYHSHPHSAPVPSATDVAEAAYPDHLHLIVSVEADAIAVRLFRLEAAGFREVTWTMG